MIVIQTAANPSIAPEHRYTGYAPLGGNHARAFGVAPAGIIVARVHVDLAEQPRIGYVSVCEPLTVPYALGVLALVKGLVLVGLRVPFAVLVLGESPVRLFPRARVFPDCAHDVAVLCPAALQKKRRECRCAQFTHEFVSFHFESVKPDFRRTGGLIDTQYFCKS